MRTARHVVAVAALAGLPDCGGVSTPTPTTTPVATPSPVASTSPTPDGWEVLPSSPVSPTNGRHDDIVFLDASNGWMVNARAEVHGTRNGGATWQPLAKLASDVFLRCVGFASLTKGWAGNLNFTGGNSTLDYALWETEDGGRTWSNISSRIQGVPVAGLCGIRVLSPSVIVAVGRWSGPAVFVKSTNGGRTWTSRSLAALTGGLVDVFFFNEHDGFAVGALGDGPSEQEQRSARTTILATADGGETWETRYLSVGVGQRAWKIHFASDRVGYVTTEGPSPEGVVLKTTDGGATWRPVMVSAGNSFEGVAFLDPDHGWVASGETLFSTSDGGTTWKRLGFGLAINRIRVVNDGVAYACGDRAYRWRR